MAISLNDLIDERIESLKELFDEKDLGLYIFNVEHNNLSVDDAVGYLHRRAWIEEQRRHSRYPVQSYFADYVKRFQMRLIE